MHPKSKTLRAFTLVEIMVVVGIFGFVAAGLIPFFIMNLKSQFVGEQKLLINGDIRKITNQMVENARESNTFVIYQAFTNQNRWDGVAESRDDTGNTVVDDKDRLADKRAGDFMVLIYYKDPYYITAFYDGDPTNNSIGFGVVERMIGYWIAPNRRYPGEFAMYMFDTDTYKVNAAATTCTTSWGVTLPATLSTTVTIESLLPPATSAYANAAEFPIMINNLSGSANGFTFVNYNNLSVITRAKILHGNLAKRVTNTYNFTITPRG